MRRLLLAILLLLGLVVLGLGGVMYATFSGLAPATAGPLPGGLGSLILDGYVSVGLLDTGDGGVVLVDAGNDIEGTAIVAGLAAMGRAPTDVRAILLTHGHRDHISAIPKFPGATVYGLSEEAPYLSGQERWKGPIPRLLGGGEDTGVRLGRPMRDGEEATIGRLQVQALATPGHTAGSAAWLVEVAGAGSPVLFVGDDATFQADGALRPAPWIFSDDPAVNRASLVALGRGLDGHGVSLVVCSHSGSGPWSAFAAFPG